MTKEQKENKILKEDLEILEESSPQEEEQEESKEELYLKQLQRLQAEFENFRRRTEKEKSQIKKNANESLISELLPILDNFELSLKHNTDQGVQIIYETLYKTLESQGLKKIDTTVPFNPQFHEALLQEPGKEDGKILEELQIGYTLNDKLLRASKVKISKKTGK